MFVGEKEERDVSGVKKKNTMPEPFYIRKPTLIQAEEAYNSDLGTH